MDLVEQIAIPSFRDKHQRRKRALAVIGSLMVAAACVEYRYGTISNTYKRMKRCVTQNRRSSRFALMTCHTTEFPVHCD